MAEPWREALSDAEVRELLEMHDWRSWLSIAVDWGTIGAALALQVDYLALKPVDVDEIRSALFRLISRRAASLSLATH